MLFLYPRLSDLSRNIYNPRSCKGGGYFFFLCLLLFNCNLIGQTTVAGSGEENDLRTEQLLGRSDSSFSFSSRYFSKSYKTDWKKPQFSILPVTLIQQYNTHHPYGWNDGAMIAANGYQVFARAGAYARYGILEAQIQPEIVYAVNSSYSSNTLYGNGGGKGYSKIFPGQSSVKISAGAFSLGISSQNLWWGPGVHSSLLMSNNAPGFVHAFFSTRRPVKTFIGDFEWQVIGGKLTADLSQPYENFNLQPSPFFVEPSNRYLSAYVISYHPKWVPGLFLGMTRALQRYKKDIQLSGSGLLERYVPVIVKPFQKENAQSDDSMRTDQLASFFLRWILKKAKAEFYIEWGYNDYNQNIRDYLESPTHSAAHLVGFKKAVLLSNDAYLDFGLELTEMSPSTDRILREAGNWYVHGEIRQGYTNNNQIMGSGAGIGCNVQTVTGRWTKGSKRLGVIFERVEHDPVYHAVKWTDISLGIVPEWNFGKLKITALFQFVRSANYIWEQDNNVFNLHSKMGMQYNF